MEPRTLETILESYKKGEYGYICKTEEEVVFDAVFSELISCASSLHMPAKPIPESEQTTNNCGFLSDTDYWVKHSVEHIHNVHKLVHFLYTKFLDKQREEFVANLKIQEAARKQAQLIKEENN